MATAKAGEYDFAVEQGHLASMENGRDAGQTTQTSVPAEMAVAEIGKAGLGVFSDYFILALGGIPDEQLKTGSARVAGNIQDNADADVPAGTALRLVLTDKQRDEIYYKTRWFDVASEIEANDVENRPFIRFPGVSQAEFVREGRIVAVQLRNAQATFTVDDIEANGYSSLQFPIVGGN